MTNFLLNWPWAAKALIFLGVFIFGMLCGIPLGGWLKMLISKKMLPNLIAYRLKARKKEKDLLCENRALRQKVMAVSAIYREAGFRTAEIMNG